VHRWLERGRVQAGLSLPDLWVECVALGGNESIDNLAAVLDGSEIPSRRRYDVIAQCLNEHLRELGDARLVPYGEDIGL
jgi:hypothetical protein